MPKRRRATSSRSAHKGFDSVSGRQRRRKLDGMFALAQPDLEVDANIEADSYVSGYIDVQERTKLEQIGGNFY